ncbi:MAG TPA: zinc-binding dehydrogenase, partial [Polyangiaceae bacterium]|nr:zinc-binding dehydrogenase [Polyangiaceae bacterium]
APTAPPGVRIASYDAIRGPAAAEKLARLIAAGPFHVHVADTFELARVAEAHRRLEAHFLGKLLLRPNASSSL